MNLIGQSLPDLRPYRNDRRQYQSCDQCRKGRRACDAARLGIDPFPSNRRNGHYGVQACSACQKYKRNCTFVWLRGVPKKVLPKILKSRLDQSNETPQSSKHFVPSTSSSLSNSQQIHNSDRLPSLDSHSQNESHQEYTSLQFTNDANDRTMHHLFWEDLAEGSNLELDNEFSWLQPSQEPSGNQSLMVDATLSTTSDRDISAYIPNGGSEPLVHQDPGNFQDITTSPVDLFHSSGQPEVDKLTVNSWGMHEQIFNEHIVQEPQIAATSDSGGLPAEGNHNAFTATRSMNTPSSPSKIATNQHCEKLNVREDQLAGVTNKVAITQSLVKIYHDSLENSLVLWITEENCPYNLKKTISGLPSTSTSTQNLYKCVNRLDAAFSGFRSSPLTRAETCGSSKALKLATMAFASQWSYSAESRIASYQGSPSPLPSTIRSNSSSYEFEHLLRQSLWNEAQRCIHRWQSCGSFKVILAEILFFLVHRPLDLDDITDLAERYQDLSNPASQHQDRPLYWNTEALSRSHSAASGMQKVPYSLQSVAFDSENQAERVQCLETALRQLLTWRKIFLSQLPPLKSRPYNKMLVETRCGSRLTPEDVLDFNGIFWMGIMCDTTSSVLNHRPLIIEDDYTSIFASPRHSKTMQMISTSNTTTLSYDPERHVPDGQSLPVNIWGSYLMDVNLRRLRILESKSTPSAKLPSEKLHEAIPIKVLMWRRIGCLQNFLEQVASPQEIENAIREALDVYQYWMIHYHTVFEACIEGHAGLSYQLQSWYVVLGMHWHLGCLLLASSVEQLDKSKRSDNLGRTLRASSALVNELKKTSAYAIADLAQVSSSPTSMAASNSTDVQDVHIAISRSAILSDPHTEKMLETLEAACKVFLEWLHDWQSSVTCNNLAWLHAVTTVSEITRRYDSCMQALELLQTRSDIVDVIVGRLGLQRKSIVLEGES